MMREDRVIAPEGQARAHAEEDQLANVATCFSDFILEVETQHARQAHARRDPGEDVEQPQMNFTRSGGVGFAAVT
jgi:hypothetical protein